MQFLVHMRALSSFTPGEYVHLRCFTLVNFFTVKLPKVALVPVSLFPFFFLFSLVLFRGLGISKFELDLFLFLTATFTALTVK